jgi:Domain of unknown function (DUF4249)
MKLKSIFISVFFVLVNSACQKTIPLKLPKYEPKMVLEFYLQDNQPLVCLLQESINYTDTARVKLIDNALIVLSYNGVNDTLYNVPYLDLKLGKFYNYSNFKNLKLLPNVEYNLYIKDRNGREMRGTTRVKEIIPIKTLGYTYDDIDNVSAVLSFNDDGNTSNYYIFSAFRNTPALGVGVLRDVRFSDILFNGKPFSFNTGYSYGTGDTITARLYHLTQEHYDFAESVSNAQSANGNPFGQPANILSNVSGGIGLFTTLNYDERVLIIQR